MGGAREVGRQTLGGWGGAGGDDEVVELMVTGVGGVDGDGERDGGGRTWVDGAGDSEGAAGDRTDDETLNRWRVLVGW